ncbi:hypothetical protein D3C76_1436440 [compost metagenome]
MIATQARVFVQRVLVVEVGALYGVTRPAFFRPVDAVCGHEAADAAVQRFDLQAAVRSEMHAFFRVIDPHIQMILLLSHPLAGQGDAHAHQAVSLVVALGITELDKAQGPPTGIAIGLQRRQTEHLRVLDVDVRPGQLDHWRCLFFSGGVG